MSARQKSYFGNLFLGKTNLHEAFPAITLDQNQNSRAATFFRVIDVFCEFNDPFHRALAGSTRNNLLVWVIDQINSVRAMDEWTRMRQLTLDTRIIRQYNRQHRQILQAIRSREPERAANHMKEHLETARLSLTRAADA